MKKRISIFLFIIIILSLTSCSFHSLSKSMMSKMNIKDLPQIENVEFVKKRKNFVSETLFLNGDMETFEIYAENVYEYLKEEFPNTIGYSEQILNSAWGMGGTYEYFNKTTSIEQFKIENDVQITYHFVFSSKDEFHTNDTTNGDNSYYLSNPCSVVVVFYKETQYVKDDSTDLKYNLGVELIDHLGENTHVLVNSDRFSKFVFAYTDNLRIKEYHINLFLKEYDLSKMTFDEVNRLINLGYVGCLDDNMTQYRFVEFGDANGDNIADKQLRIFYNEDSIEREYVRHEIVDIVYEK